MRAIVVVCVLTVVLGAGGCVAAGGGSGGAVPRDVELKVAEAEFGKAQNLLGERQYREAGLKFLELAEEFRRLEDGLRAAEAVFWVGYCCEKQESWDDARRFYETVMREHVGTAAARQAEERLKRLPPRTP